MVAALREYAEDWQDRLFAAPNHADRRLSHLPDRGMHGTDVWRHDLRDQFDVTEAEFWPQRCSDWLLVSAGCPPTSRCSLRYTTGPRRGFADVGGCVSRVEWPSFVGRFALRVGATPPYRLGVGYARSGLDPALAGCGRRAFGLQAERRLRRAPARRESGSRCRVGFQPWWVVPGRGSLLTGTKGVSGTYRDCKQRWPARSSQGLAACSHGRTLIRAPPARRGENPNLGGRRAGAREAR